MPQYARPDEDIAGVWNPSPGYVNIDEVVADDGDGVEGSVNHIITTNFIEFGLSAVQDPNSAASHIIRYRVDQSEDSVPHSGVSADIRAVLKEGSTTIASTPWVTPSKVSVTQYTYTLSGAEAGAISGAGYATALRLRFEIRLVGGVFPDANDVNIRWAEFEVPSQTPAAPTGLAVVPSWRDEKLTWEDNSGNETGFRIERRPPGDPFVVVIVTPPDIEEYTDPLPPIVIPPPDPPPTYCYRVYAVNAFGDSDPTAEVCAQLLAPITNNGPVAVEPAQTEYSQEHGESATYTPVTT